ncbi:MAG: hypothetical protein WCO26_05720 [Deltaproteobacteria bacterium]
MKFKKTSMFSILLLITFMVAPLVFSQGRSEKVISFSGVIESIPKDSAYIVISEARVLVSGAKIVSDKGSVLGIGDLKPRLYVTVEAVKRANGVFAKKVTVISAPRIPKNVGKVP